MRHHKLGPNHHVFSTTWFGGLVHVDGIGFWNTLTKFLKVSIYHIKFQLRSQ